MIKLSNILAHLKQQHMKIILSVGFFHQQILDDTNQSSKSLALCKPLFHYNVCVSYFLPTTSLTMIMIH
jgi:hypothetical protein